MIAAVVVAVLTVLLGLGVHARARAKAERSFEDRARGLARTVDHHLAAPLGALRAVSAFASVDATVDPVRFQRFARTLRSQHPSLAALEWADRVEGHRRGAFEAEVTARIGRPFRVREPGPDGLMVPSPDRDHYVVLTLLEPPLPEVEGLDVRFEASRRLAVDTAIESGAMLATSRFRLVEDPPDVHSIAVYDPVGERGAAVRGLGIALYRLEPLARAALVGVDLERVSVALLDEDASLPEAERLLFESQPGARAPSADRFTRREPLRFVGRSWLLVVSEPADVDADALWIIVFVGGIVATSTGLWLRGRRARAELERALRRERELGEYTLISKLGEGGMGAVYEARHRLLRRRVAVKIVRPEKATPELTARFNREAQTTAELTHPNTVTLFDYGVTEDGRLFLVMEYLDGLTLEDLVDRFGPQPPERVRHLLVQACRALAEAHQRGVIHRDIKPANLMTCRFGGQHDFLKVLDFGLAKIGGAVDTRLSAPGAILGTLSCMAPECLLDAGAAGARSDVYAVGCVAYFLLAGRDVFEGTSDTALLSAHLVTAPPALPTSVPEPLRAIVMKCLAKEPAERYQTAAQLAHALTHLDLPPWSEPEAAEWWAQPAMAECGPPSRRLSRVEALRPKRGGTPSAPSAASPGRDRPR